MNFKEFKKIVKTKGLSELSYIHNYRQNCRAPNKLSLFKFTNKVGLKQAKLLHTGNMQDKIPNNLPDSFCLKPVDGAGARGCFLIHKGTNIKDNKKYTLDEIRKKYLEDTTFYVGYSKDYYIEELLLHNGDIPDDISFFMIKDQIGTILQAKRIGQNKGKVFYDANWNVIGTVNKQPKKPNSKLISELNQTAKKIMNHLGVPFLRIDMYAIENKGVYIGEFAAVSGVPSNKPSASFLEIEDGIILDQYLGFILEEELIKYIQSKKVL